MKLLPTPFPRLARLLPLLTALLLSSTSTPAVAASPPKTQTTTSIAISIPASAALPNPHAHLPPSTLATLSALRASHSAPLNTANGFVFSNVSAGSYLLDIHCATHFFAPLRVDVLLVSASAGGPGDSEKLRVAAWETFRGNDWDNKGEAAPRNGAGAFEVKNLGMKAYFMERSSFSVFSILKNPMILIALVTMGIFIGMPYLLENMDPEVRAEFEARQKSNPMNSMLGGGPQGGGGGSVGNFDMAAFLAGSSSSSKKDEAVTGGSGSGSGSGPAASLSSSSGGKKGQGRR